MDINDAIKTANENLNCSLATIDGDQPRVRIVQFWYADETGFYFQIGGMKDMYKQIQENPKIEACFFEQNDMGGKLLRVAGNVEFLDDEETKKRCIKERPFLKELFGMDYDDPNLIIFRISTGQAYFWTPQLNLEPKHFIEF